jgi:hypothetical protein
MFTEKRSLPAKPAKFAELTASRGFRTRLADEQPYSRPTLQVALLVFFM